MSRVALVSSEPIRERMAGIGIRYLEMARRLPAAGIEVLLLSPSAPAEAAALGLEPASVGQLERGALSRQVAGCDAVVAQGQWANDVVLEIPDLPVAIDLYDPWLVENLHYAETSARSVPQRSRLLGTADDAAICFFAAPRQRQFYLGFLAVGRVNPLRRGGPGAPLADRRGAVRRPDGSWRASTVAAREGRRRAAAALSAASTAGTTCDPALRARVSSDRTGMCCSSATRMRSRRRKRLLGEVESWARTRGWWGGRVQVLDWVPSDRRYDLLRDVDLLVPGITRPRDATVAAHSLSRCLRGGLPGGGERRRSRQQVGA